MSCGCNSNETNNTQGTTCTGCVCSVLRNLVTAPINPCQINNRTFTILFGDPNLDIGGLIFKGLDEKNCCARFIDEQGNSYAFDCRKLQGISCTVATNNTGNFIEFN